MEVAELMADDGKQRPSKSGMENLRNQVRLIPAVEFPPTLPACPQ